MSQSSAPCSLAGRVALAGRSILVLAGLGRERGGRLFEVGIPPLRVQLLWGVSWLRLECGIAAAQIGFGMLLLVDLEALKSSRHKEESASGGARRKHISRKREAALTSSREQHRETAGSCTCMETPLILKEFQEPLWASQCVWQEWMKAPLPGAL